MTKDEAQPARILIGKEFFDQLGNGKIKEEALRKVYRNFIDPLRAGNDANELEGKYKPSWELPKEVSSLMRAAIAKTAKQHNLYHYHYGFPFYDDGNDPKYPGKVSAGILHTSIKNSEAVDQHLIVKAEENHPSPFQIPIPLVLDVAGAIH